MVTMTTAGVEQPTVRLESSESESGQRQRRAAQAAAHPRTTLSLTTKTSEKADGASGWQPCGGDDPT